MKPAIKDSSNPFFKMQYADLASVWEACRKPLSDNGLSIVQTLDDGKVETILLHTSGQYVSSVLAFTAKEQTSQSIGSAITYARRYALSALVGICPDDDDGEAAMGRSEPAIGGKMKYTKEPPKQPGPTPGVRADMQAAVDEADKKPATATETSQDKNLTTQTGKREPNTIKTTTELYKACFADFGLQPNECLKELNINKWSELVDTPQEAYKKISAAR